MMRTSITSKSSSVARACAAALCLGLLTPLAANAQPAITERLENGAPYTFANLIERVSPAVVSVNVTLEPSARGASPFGFGADPEAIPPEFEEFFRRFGIEPDQIPQQPPERVSQGSGFFVSSDGYIVTNNHVVNNAASVVVTLREGEELDAEIVGVDPSTDLAVLKVEGDEPFPFVEFAEEGAFRVGDWVVAMGNPFGLGGTATAGIISATGREIAGTVYNEFLQIDAPINRGNSGGPAFDLQGRVIGVNSQIFSPSGGNVGIGFAIPAPVAHRIVNAIIEEGRVVRGWLGVGIDAVDEDVAASLGLDEARGAIVNEVHAGGPAEDAGFQEGDIILSVDDVEVENRTDLVRRVGDLVIGERVRFTVYRNGRERQLTATIGERPGEEELAALTTGPNGPPGAGSGEGASAALGLTLRPLSDADRRSLGVTENYGLLIEGVDRTSAAAEKGLGAGVVILEAAGQPVSTVAEFNSQIEDAREEGAAAVLLRVQVQQRPRFVALPLESEEE